VREQLAAFAPQVSLAIERRGQPMTLTYSID